MKVTEHHLSQLAFIEEFLMESRNFTRVDFCECVSIKHDDQIFFGDIKNLSLQGLFIKTPEKLPLSTPVEITFFFSRNSSMYLNANVVRCEEAGLGIQISGMDVKSFVHLRNVVSMQCNDHDLLMQETLKVTNCIH
jgi:hypothetical protein